MSKLEAGLVVPTKVSSSTREVYDWLPHVNHRELDRPVTNVVVGLARSQERYYPVEFDITSKQVNTLFVVGNSDSRKEDIVKGLLEFQGDRTAVGYLHLKMILGQENSYKLNTVVGIKRHLNSHDISTAPDGVIAGKILKRLWSELENEKGMSFFAKDDPKIMVIDDLGNFIRKASPENVELLKRIVNYKGKKSFALICMVNDSDLDLLAQEGIDPNLRGGGMWLIGQSSITTEAFPDATFPPGHFLQWSPRKKQLGKLPILPFIK